MSHEHTHHHGTGIHGEAHGHLADILDLDAHILQDFVDEVLDWTQPFIADHRQVVDLGAGTGTWTVALAQRFTDATVTAVDLSEKMLERVRGKAAEHGLTDRVHTVVADLDADLSAVGSVDLAWAALSLHEVTDPGHALGNVYDAMNPGGILTIIEMIAPPTFLPEDIGIGRPGLEKRIREVENAGRAGKALHPDWSPKLLDAGFESVAERTFSIDPTPPYPESAVRYADTYLRRIRTKLGDHLDADDRETLDALLAEDGPHGLRHRSDLEIRGSRTAWVVRRPNDD